MTQRLEYLKARKQDIEFKREYSDSWQLSNKYGEELKVINLEISKEREAM